jgi:uncharacterized protein (UPF0548 family)
MLLLRKPSPAAIDAFLETQARLGFSYQAIGATAAEPPRGYDVDHTHTKLGVGRGAFIEARAALQNWEHFRLGWVEPCWPDLPIEPGKVVGILARICGLWLLNACRIVYIFEDDDRFGFAYGTLPDHAESGEERFSVERHREDDSVWYDIIAFSRPNQLLSRVGYPIVRRLQKRFACDSAAAMVTAVSQGVEV